MYMVQIQNDDLVHYGILGMKWGIRRYQPYSVRGRGSGKRGKEIGEAAKEKQKAGKRLSRKEKKALAQREEAKRRIIESRNQEVFDEQRIKAKKEQLLREGKASEILEYKKYFTDQELSNVVNRLRSVESLQGMSKREVETTFQKIDDIMKKTKTVSEWGDTGIKIWNQMVGIYNTTEEGKKKPMKLIKTSDGGSKKKK